MTLSANEKKLVEIYKQAQKNLISVFLDNNSNIFTIRSKKAMLDKVNKELARLNKVSVRSIEEQLKMDYMRGMWRAEKSIAEWFEQEEKAGRNPYAFSVEEMTVINTNAIKALVDDYTIRLQVANKALSDSMVDVIKNKIITGQTIKQSQSEIAKLIYEVQDGAKSIVINGRKYNVENYAKTVARSATREATNTASKNTSKFVGSNLLKMSTHNPTCEVCGPLQGRVYSVDGNHPIYPPIKSAWGHEGYANIHPNCRHVFSPYIEALKSDEELEKIRKFSNRPIDQDSRSKRSIEMYNKDQKAKAERWRDRKQYERYKAILGGDMPKTFSGFRRMKKADGDNWKELRRKYLRLNRAMNSDGFIESKTIQEAEKFAKKFADVVSFDNIDLEQANRINKTLNKIYKQSKREIPKIGDLRIMTRSDYNAFGDYTFRIKRLRLNAHYYKDKKTEIKAIKQKKEYAKQWLKINDNPDKYTKESQKIARKYKISGRYTVSERLEDTLTHEFGHHLDWTIIKADRKKATLTSKYQYNKGKKISVYAASSMHEYIAESFLCYAKGELNVLEKDIIDYYDSIFGKGGFLK